jgi:hypothetical protein
MTVNTTTLAGIMAASWGNFYDVDRPATSPTPAQLAIPWIHVSIINSTDVQVIIMTPSVTPGSYRGDVSESTSFSSPVRTFNDVDGIFTLTGLTPGKEYRLRAACHAADPSIYGAYKYHTFTMPKAANVGSVSSTANGVAVPRNVPPEPSYVDTTTLSGIQAASGNVENNANDAGDSNETLTPVPTGSYNAVAGNRQVTRSLFKVTNNSKDKDAYSIAVKNLGISTSSSYYTFGAALFFQSSVTNTDASGGFGFFTSSNGMDGYYVMMETTSNLSIHGEKEVKILKVVGGKKTILSDSQNSSSSTMNGIVGAKNYKIDIKVKASATVNVIDIYINNFKISAVDTNTPNTTDPTKLILPVTSNVALVSSVGSSNFDYVYAAPISESQYTTGVLQNVYNGQFATTTLDFLYGEKVLSNFNKAEIPGGKLEEFGTVARELRKVAVKYQDRPAQPLYSTVGINKFIQILGQRLTSFGAEIYLLNNSGTFVPLSDGQFNSFNVIGNYVVPTGQHEYTDSTINEFSTPEPAIFESVWIQTESDAKKLSDWIKTQWSKQQVILSMNVFSNPLISVGDVNSVNYPDNGLDGTKKYIVTNVNQSFNQGLDTSITARSIYV